MGRECNSIFRENSGLERLPFELAQSVDEIEGPEIDSLRSAAFQRFQTRLRRRKPNQRYPIKILNNENEEKNEILSRTTVPCRRLCILAYIALIAILFSRVMGVCATTVPLKSSSLVEERRSAYQRPNKNCKEFDVTSRAYLADLIFEGTARSRSPAHGRSGRYEVTFVIQNILKQRNNGPERLSPKKQVRLHFQERDHRRRRLDDCPPNRVKSTRLVKANVKTGGMYFVFAHQLSPMNYTARGEPIVNNRRNRKSIQSVLLRSKEKPPRVLGLQNVSRGVSTPLRLSCQVRGLPVPRITWSKDGTSLIPTPRIIITYYRKNSTIDIASVRVEDAGRYMCSATSVTGASASVTAYVNVTNYQVERTTTRPSNADGELMHAEPCEVETFCLNNGKCRYIRSMGEHLCLCDDGFRGPRCEHKEVSGDWFSSSVENEMMTLKTLYRRRVRGHFGLNEADYRAVLRSIGDNKRLRHWLSLQRPLPEEYISTTEPQLTQLSPSSI